MHSYGQSTNRFIAMQNWGDAVFPKLITHKHTIYIYIYIYIYIHILIHSFEIYIMHIIQKEANINKLLTLPVLSHFASMVC